MQPTGRGLEERNGKRKAVGCFIKYPRHVAVCGIVEFQTQSPQAVWMSVSLVVGCCLWCPGQQPPGTHPARADQQVIHGLFILPPHVPHPLVSFKPTKSIATCLLHGSPLAPRQSINAPERECQDLGSPPARVNPRYGESGGPSGSELLPRTA